MLIAHTINIFKPHFFYQQILLQFWNFSMNSFPSTQEAKKGRGAGKTAIWEPSVLLSHSVFWMSGLFSTFSPEGTTSDTGVPSSEMWHWPEGDPGVDAENGAEEEAEVRKAGKRSGSCRPLLALGERGRGEKGKLAKSFDSSGEASLVITTTMNKCRFLKGGENISLKHLKSSSSTPDSWKTASQLETTCKGKLAEMSTASRK